MIHSLKKNSVTLFCAQDYLLDVMYFYYCMVNLPATLLCGNKKSKLTFKGSIFMSSANVLTAKHAGLSLGIIY